MEITFTQTRGTIPEDLNDLIKLAQAPDLMELLGLGLASLWQRAFDEPELRPSPWAPRKDRSLTHPLLKLSGHFWRSPKAHSWTATSVVVSSDVPYAAIHQFGGQSKSKTTATRLSMGELEKKNYFIMPPRPSFPMLVSGQLTQRAERELQDVADKYFGDGWMPGGS